MFRISKEELKILKKKILQTDPLKTLGNREETLLFYFNYKKKINVFSNWKFISQKTETHFECTFQFEISRIKCYFDPNYVFCFELL